MATVELAGFADALRPMAMAFDEMTKACQAFIDAMTALTIDQIGATEASMTSSGRFMFRVARWFGVPPLDAFVWCEQFPGAYRSDFGDGWE